MASKYSLKYTESPRITYYPPSDLKHNLSIIYLCHLCLLCYSGLGGKKIDFDWHSGKYYFSIVTDAWDGRLIGCLNISLQHFSLKLSHMLTATIVSTNILHAVAWYFYFSFSCSSYSLWFHLLRNIHLYCWQLLRHDATLMLTELPRVPVWKPVEAGRSPVLLYLCGVVPSTVV